LYGISGKWRKNVDIQLNGNCETYKINQKASRNGKEPQLKASCRKLNFYLPKPLRQSQNAIKCTSESEARNQHPSRTAHLPPRNGFPTSPHKPNLKVSAQSDTFYNHNNLQADIFFYFQEIECFAQAVGLKRFVDSNMFCKNNSFTFL
jgi:hypothetical protein